MGRGSKGKVRDRVTKSTGIVGVGSWGVYYVDESPHKARDTRMCVGERVCSAEAVKGALFSGWSGSPDGVCGTRRTLPQEASYVQEAACPEHTHTALFSPLCPSPLIPPPSPALSNETRVDTSGQRLHGSNVRQSHRGYSVGSVQSWIYVTLPGLDKIHWPGIRLREPGPSQTPPEPQI